MGEAAIISLVLGLVDRALDLREAIIEAAQAGGQFTDEQRAEQRARLASQRARLDEQDARLARIMGGG